ncbi:MAG: type VI secretion system contractile sheath small subunit, partial [Rhodocyclaceae bacterium]
MDFQFNFGTLAATVPQRPKGGPGVFLVAVLGDFSGRANRGQLEIGAELARRKPIRIDADNIDRVLASFAATLRLPAGAGGGALEVSPRSIDDLHPDALYENLPVFAQLADLRQRLDNPRTFQRAADQVAAWTADASPPPAAARR